MKDLMLRPDEHLLSRERSRPVWQTVLLEKGAPFAALRACQEGDAAIGFKLRLVGSDSPKSDTQDGIATRFFANDLHGGPSRRGGVRRILQWHAEIDGRVYCCRGDAP